MSIVSSGLFRQASDNAPPPEEKDQPSRGRRKLTPREQLYKLRGLPPPARKESAPSPEPSDASEPDEIKHDTQEVGRTPAPEAPAAPRKGKRPGWTPERRAKMEKLYAARGRKKQTFAGKRRGRKPRTAAQIATAALAPFKGTTLAEKIAAAEKRRKSGVVLGGGRAALRKRRKRKYTRRPAASDDYEIKGEPQIGRRSDWAEVRGLVIEPGVPPTPVEDFDTPASTHTRGLGGLIVQADAKDFVAPLNHAQVPPGYALVALATLPVATTLEIFNTQQGTRLLVSKLPS